MFTTVNVECKSSGKQMPRINAHALIFEGGKNYVVTVTPDNRLKVKEVDVYKRQNQECYVRSGLSEGDRVLRNHTGNDGNRRTKKDEELIFQRKCHNIVYKLMHSILPFLVCI